MRYIAAVALLISSLAVAQTASVKSVVQSGSITLPKDNGKTTSFKESIEVGKRAEEYFDSLCCRLRSIELVQWCHTNKDQMVARLNMNQWGNGITATVTLTRCGRYVNYCFDDYRVNTYPLDEWLPTTKYEVAEQIKSTIFTNTVLILAEVRNPGVAKSMRR